MANAGFGLCGSYDVPLEIWNDRVPSKVITQIRNWKAETSKYPVHPLTDLSKVSCKVLLRDGLLHTPASDMDSNCYAFVKTKNTHNCAFIVDMRILIEECTIKPRRSPPPTVAETFNKIEEMRRQGPVFGTTIDLTNFYWSLRMATELREGRTFTHSHLGGTTLHLLPKKHCGTSSDGTWADSLAVGWYTSIT